MQAVSGHACLSAPHGVSLCKLPTHIGLKAQVHFDEEELPRRGHVVEDVNGATVATRKVVDACDCIALLEKPQDGVRSDKPGCSLDGLREGGDSGR